MNSTSSSHTKTLFKSISVGLNKIFEKLQNGSAKLEFNGIWPFLYNSGSNSLKSVAPIFFNEKKINLTEEEKEELKNTIINYNHGSIGHAFKNIKENSNYDILYQTFNEPRGVVCYLDSKIKQEHAVFIAIKNDDEILGILDLFFNGEIAKEGFTTFAKSLWKEFNGNETLKRLCTNTFIIQQFDELQQLSSSSKQNGLIKPINKIENILELSGNTPIFYFTYGDQPVSKEYVGMNFKTIYDFVAHEYRFCGLVKKEINCYYKKETTEYLTECNNRLLKNFYYEIFKEKDFAAFRKRDLIILDSTYIVEVISKKNVKNEDINISNKDNKNFEKKLKQFQDDYIVDNIAINKFKDEMVFSYLKRKFGDKKTVVLVLYRIVEKPLVYQGEHCNKHLLIGENTLLSQYISPSELLHLQYNPSVEINVPLLERAKDDDSGPNVVHFEILENNRTFFIESIKEKIAGNPEIYRQSLAPYLGKDYDTSKYQEAKEEELKGYDNLKLYYVGANPLSKDNHYHSMIKEQISLIYSEFKEKETQRYADEAKQSATRAAISQVMARNMSHNVGSHVLSKLLTADQIYKIFKDSDWQCKNGEDSMGVENKPLEIHPNYKYIALFFDYLKARMDYLADITTSTPVIENVMGLYNDITRSFVNNRVLNDRISGISGYNYFIATCSYNETLCPKKACSTCVYNINVDDKKGEDIEDINISVPNDVLGKHAIYTILENIIRNTAKHSNKNENVEFTIKVEDATVYADKTGIELSLEEFYSISIFDNCDISGKIEALVDEQNVWLNKKILDDSGRLRHGGWGLIEMAASAAYLRKLPIEAIDSNEYRIKDNPIVTEGNKLCILQAYSEQGKYLGYRFFVHKPHEILIIAKDDKIVFPTSSNAEEKRALINKYKKEGVWIKSEEEIDRDSVNGVIYPHNLVVILGDNAGIDLNNNSRFSKRYLIKEDDRLVLPKGKDTEIEKFKLNLWKEYYQKAEIRFYSNKDNGDKFKILEKEKSTIESHGKSYCEYIFGIDTKPDDKYSFVEIKTSATEHFFFDLRAESYINGIKQRASETIPILVLDERIQDFAYNNKYSLKANENCEVSSDKCYHKKGGIPYHIVYENTNIKVPNPEKDCNLNAQSFSPVNQESSNSAQNESNNENNKTEYEKIIKVLITFIGEKNNEPQFFIVIHLGIIEKLINAKNQSKKDQAPFDKDNKDSIREFIENEILGENNKSFYDNIVVTSGRGTPQNIPEGIRYLNFSVISQYLITLRNKYALTEALYSARKTNTSKS